MKSIRGLFKVVRSCYLDYRLKQSDGIIVYYIEIKGNVNGFFALLRGALDYCCYADENGFVPYIKYNREILYAENRFFLQTNNPFEYYFEQPIDYENKFILKNISLVKCQGNHMDQMELKYNLKPISYLIEESYINKMAQIYKKYFHLNDNTRGKIKKNVKRILKEKKTLGVHIRGTDFYKEFNNHPVPITVNEYAEYIENEVRAHDYEQIFVATDDKRCLKEIRKKIQVPLVYYKSTMRADNNKSVAFERNRRKHNNYLLGLEVLRDVYTLVACKGFLGCLSQMDMFVQIIKKSEDAEFDSLYIINKGIFSNNRQCWEPTK